MTDPTQPQPRPSWGPPPAPPGPIPPQPPIPPKRHNRRTAIILATVGAVATLIALSYALQPTGTEQGAKVADTTEPTMVPEDEDAGVPITEPEPEPTKPAGPPVVRVGQTLEMTDGFGDTVAEITVGGPTSPSRHKGVRFSTGGEYDDPKHGLYLGAWVKVKALQDGVETVYGDLHVAQGGRHYEGDACCPDGFSPTLDYATLSKGEVSEGWVVFDIRSRKGEIVIADYDGKRLGAWKF